MGSQLTHEKGGSRGEDNSNGKKNKIKRFSHLPR